MNSGSIRVRDFKSYVDNTPEPNHYRFKFTASYLVQKDFSSLSDPFFTVHAYPFPWVSCFNPSSYNQTTLYTNFSRNPLNTLNNLTDTTQILNTILPPTIKDYIQMPEDYMPKIYISEVINNNHFPEWKEFELHFEDCGGNYSDIEIKVVDYDRDGTHNEIGTCKVTLTELLTNNANFKLKKIGKKGQQGLLHVKQVLPLTVTLDQFHLSTSFSVSFKARRVEKKKMGTTQKIPTLI